VRSNKKNAENIENTFAKVLNFAQIYEENQKVILRSFYMTKGLTILKVFENSQHENISQILFPDKAKNLNGYPLFVAFDTTVESFILNAKLHNKWNYFVKIVAEKLNAKIEYILFKVGNASMEIFRLKQKNFIKTGIIQNTLDFYLDSFPISLDLQSYYYIEQCFLVPLPPEYSIYQLILTMPLDKSCWMWLGITIAVSTLVWRIFEGHWGFLFGACAKFVGQFVKIKT
jgi:hypothetical protein